MGLRGWGLGVVGVGAADHPLLGAAVALAEGEGWLFTGRLSLETHPWLADHAVMGVVLLPGTAFVELALCAGSRVGCGVVRELTLEAPLLLEGDEGVLLQVVVEGGDERGERSLAVYSRRESGEQEPGGEGEGWTRHASGVLGVDAGLLSAGVAERAGLLGDDVWPPRDGEVIDLDGLYDQLAEQGFEYGPVFQGLQAAWRRGTDLFAEVALPEQANGESVTGQGESFAIHPALLDATFHTALAQPNNQHNEGMLLPFSFSGVELYSPGARRCGSCFPRWMTVRCRCWPPTPTRASWSPRSSRSPHARSPQHN